MIASDRRRVAAASLFTVLALPALWVLNRESAATSNAPTVGAAGVDAAAPVIVAPVGEPAAPTTQPYVPDPPLFVSGEPDAEAPSGPAVVNVAVPPAPGPTEVVGNASFRRFAGSRQCTTLLAPDGATLTVVNIDNGQTTTCSNSYGMTIPAGADIVLHTDVFSEIGDLADAPVPVRVSW